MLDLVEPVGLPADGPEVSLLVCPKCAAEFAPKRSNQKFCSVQCSKAATRNAARSNRKGENGAASVRHHERASRLAEMVYSVPPTERFGVLKDILTFVNKDAGLRRILTDPKLLRQQPRRNGGKNIAQMASVYTHMFYGVSIKTYIKHVQNGTLNEDHPVSVKRDHGSVPRLGPIKKVKCWHKPLTNPHPNSP